MSDSDVQELRTKFLKVFPSVPLELRDEIIAIIDENPVSWKAAFLEIQDLTQKGELILKKLKDMGIIS